MSSTETPQLDPPNTAMLRRPALALLVTYFLLLPAFVVPFLDAARSPFLDLTSNFAAVLWSFAATGSALGAIILGGLLTMLLVMRSGLTNQARCQQAVVIGLVLAGCAGGGAAVNEHVIKPTFAVPRPNIVFLAETTKGRAPMNMHGELGMSAETFYALGDKATRRGPLRTVLESNPLFVAMSETIREHWIAETGYSFPSGHAYFAMLFATFFLMMSTATTIETSAKRGWLFYLLLPWALMVCYSRTLLRVHTPGDIAVGGLLGMAVGMAGFVMAWKVIGKWCR